ncbi:MAG: LamG domain-containing protein, partial [Bacteroidaceae bacterium]|nr:LamG domain-containing protein [Bacteroidaceae bacterium]
FDISITSDGKLKATVEGTSYVSDKTVPQGKWCYLNVSYDNTSGATRLDANVAYEGAETQLFALENVASYTGNGAITIGDKINAAIHEVTLWNNWRTWAMAKNGMNQTHAASTDGLIGYWHLDEGHGTVGEDKARSRHLALPAGNNWSMENDNYALTLDGKSYAALDLSKTGSDDDQNYMLEFWFRADKQAADATIMHVHKGVPASDLELIAANDGSLSLNVNGETTIVTTDNMTDNAWHHFSLNVLKGISGMATAYVDGVAKAQVSADKLPAVRTDKLVMGAHRTYNGGTSDNYAYSQYFKGDIDEVRFWNATQTAALIRDNMYNKVDAETAGSLALYYPFEKRTVDSGNQSVIVADLADHSATKGDNAIIGGT